MMRHVFPGRKPMKVQKELRRLRQVVTVLTAEINASFMLSLVPFIEFFEQNKVVPDRGDSAELLISASDFFPALTVLNSLKVRMRLKISADVFKEELQHLSDELGVNLSIVKSEDRRGYFSFSMHKSFEEEFSAVLKDAFDLMSSCHLQGV